MLKGSFWPAGRSGGQLYWHHQALVAPPHSHSHDGRGRRDDCSGGCAGQVVALGDGALLTNGPSDERPSWRAQRRGLVKRGLNQVLVVQAV